MTHSSPKTSLLQRNARRVRAACWPLALAAVLLAVLFARRGGRQERRQEQHAHLGQQEHQRQRTQPSNTNVNVNEVNKNTNVNVNTNRHVDVDVDVDRGWHPVATVAAVAVTAAVIGSVVNTLPPSGCLSGADRQRSCTSSAAATGTSRSTTARRCSTWWSIRRVDHRRCAATAAAARRCGGAGAGVAGRRRSERTRSGRQGHRPDRVADVVPVQRLVHAELPRHRRLGEPGRLSRRDPVRRCSACRTSFA